MTQELEDKEFVRSKYEDAYACPYGFTGRLHTIFAVDDGTALSEICDGEALAWADARRRIEEQAK